MDLIFGWDVRVTWGQGRDAVEAVAGMSRSWCADPDDEPDEPFWMIPDCVDIWVARSEEGEPVEEPTLAVQGESWLRDAYVRAAAACMEHLDAITSDRCAEAAERRAQGR